MSPRLYSDSHDATYLYDAALAGDITYVPGEMITPENLIAVNESGQTVAQIIILEGAWEQLLPQFRTPDVVFAGQDTSQGSAFDLLAYNSLLHTLPPEPFFQHYKRIRWEILPKHENDADPSEEDREWLRSVCGGYLEGMAQRRWEKRRVWDISRENRSRS